MSLTTERIKDYIWRLFVWAMIVLLLAGLVWLISFVFALNSINQIKG
jgi:hypothetical protein